jgi:hypothetical protein
MLRSELTFFIALTHMRMRSTVFALYAAGWMSWVVGLEDVPHTWTITGGLVILVGVGFVVVFEHKRLQATKVTTPNSHGYRCLAHALCRVVWNTVGLFVCFVPSLCVADTFTGSHVLVRSVQGKCIGRLRFHAHRCHPDLFTCHSYRCPIRAFTLDRPRCARRPHPGLILIDNGGPHPYSYANGTYSHFGCAG